MRNYLLRQEADSALAWLRVLAENQNYTIGQAWAQMLLGALYDEDNDTSF